MMTIAQTTDVEQAIVVAAMDYYEGWFNGEPDRMERAPHPEPVKRSLPREGSGNQETPVPEESGGLLPAG